MCKKYEYTGTLLNEQLRNIDPSSNNLSDFQRDMILRECRINFKYFLEAIVFKGKKDSLLYKIYKTLVGGEKKWKN